MPSSVNTTGLTQAAQGNRRATLGALRKSSPKLSKPDEAFAPVGFDPETYVAHRSAQDMEFRQTYEALADEFSALDALLRARRAAGLTQAEVAGRMGIKASSLARIEGSLGSRNHSPSLATLRKYAQACGMHLTINLA